MRTYFDQNRLGPETARRFHACDLERVGGYVKAKIERHGDIRRLVEETRHQLPERTRKAERERRDMLGEGRSKAGREKPPRAQPERRMPKGYEW